MVLNHINTTHPYLQYALLAYAPVSNTDICTYVPFMWLLHTYTVFTRLSEQCLIYPHNELGPLPDQ